MPFQRQFLGMNDRFEVGQGLFEVFVDDQIFRVFVVRHFTIGVAHTSFDGRGVVGTAAAQALFQHFARRRQNEDTDRIGHFLFHLAGTLPVDFEDDVLAAIEQFLRRCARAAIEIIENPSVLQKFLIFHHLLECRYLDEVVCTAVDFARALRPRGMRHTHSDTLGVLFQQRFNQAGLAGTRGCRNSKQAGSIHAVVRSSSFAVETAPYCNDSCSLDQYTCADIVNSTTMLTQSYLDRFEGLARVFGAAALEPLQRAHFCIVGVGGVGSWAAEACARSGIGQITLIDHDDIHISNTNRQLHTLDSNIGQSKVEVLRQRILEINPECACSAVDDLVTRGNIEKFNFKQYDYVIDAIDHVSHKLTLMHHCRRNKIRCISTGGAGGLTDPTRIEVNDLTRSYNDPLLAKVRATLRQQLYYSRNPKRRYSMDCVFSSEQSIYPAAGGAVSHEKPESAERTTLDCATGIGSFVGVTACFGFTAVSHAIRKYLANLPLASQPESRDEL